MNVPKFMKKAAAVMIAGKFEIQVDAGDADRVAIHEWVPVENGKHVTFKTEIGRSTRGPEFQLLGSFILAQKPSVYVRQKDLSKPLDYRRANLAVYQAPGARPVLRAARA